MNPQVLRTTSNRQKKRERRNEASTAATQDATASTSQERVPTTLVEGERRTSPLVEEDGATTDNRITTTTVDAPEPRPVSGDVSRSLVDQEDADNIPVMGKRRIDWEDPLAEGSKQGNKRLRPIPLKSTRCTLCGCKDPLKHKATCPRFQRGTKENSGQFKKKAPEPEQEQVTPPIAPIIFQEQEVLDLASALSGTPGLDNMAALESNVAGNLPEPAYSPSSLITDEVSVLITFIIIHDPLYQT